MVGAVLFERVFDQGGDAIFEQINRGVSLFFWGCFTACFILTLQAEGEAELTLAKLACRTIASYLELPLLIQRNVFCV